MSKTTTKGITAIGVTISCGVVGWALAFLAFCFVIRIRNLSNEGPHFLVASANRGAGRGDNSEASDERGNIRINEARAA